MQEHSPAPGVINEFLRLGDLAVPLAVRTACTLGIADHFEEGPTTPEVLAGRLSVQVGPLTRLLRALAAAGVLAEEGQGAFRLTDIGHLMRRDHPLSMRDAFTAAATEVRAWSQLEYCVLTGRSGFERSYGETHRSYRARHPEEDLRMDRAHKAATRVELLMLARAYPWAEVRVIVDVGGGTGMFLAGLLQRFPDLRGTLFDLPRMIANAPQVLDEYGVAGRCSVVAGSFFEQVPSGGDVYVLKAVVGGWDDESCVRILTTVRRAMPAESRLLVIEPVMGAGEFSRGNVVQLQSFVLYGGKDRTLGDYESLFEAAGLKLRRVFPRATLPIIETVPK